MHCEQCESGKNSLVIRGAICACALLLPRVVPGLGWWPGYLLVPLLVAVGLSFAVPSARGPWPCARVGRFTGSAVTWAVVIALGASAALVMFDRLRPGEVSSLALHFPAFVWRWAGPAGLVFSLLNAFLEEAIYRGILHDAIDAAAGRTCAIVLTAAAFGLAHFYGFPSGRIGVVMAIAYGAAMSLLRVSSGGLLLPVLVHACADGTIWWLLLHQRGGGA
jgi:membrane protease YdiL (CAAX protease family)